jgi:hypothetical protein
MRLDPRRNIAATIAGAAGVALFVAIELYEPRNLLNPLRLILLGAGLAALAAGSWPAPRLRLRLLLIATPIFLLVAFAGAMTVGLFILPVALIAGFAALIEYQREGRA